MMIIGFLKPCNQSGLEGSILGAIWIHRNRKQHVHINHERLGHTRSIIDSADAVYDNVSVPWTTKNASYTLRFA